MVFDPIQLDYSPPPGGSDKGNPVVPVVNPRLQEEAIDSLPHQQKPDFLKKLKAKAHQLGHDLEKKAKQAGKQLNHTAKDLNHQAQEHHVVDKVKKVVVAAGSHGLLGPGGAVAAEAIKAADKAKAKPQAHPNKSQTDDAHKQTATAHKATHIDITNPYDALKHVLKH
jgi:hypothetical protein